MNYKMVQEHIENSLNTQVTLITIQRYDRQQYGIKYKTTIELIIRDIEYLSFIISEFDHSLSMAFF